MTSRAGGRRLGHRGRAAAVAAVTVAALTAVWAVADRAGASHASREPSTTPAAQAASPAQRSTAAPTPAVSTPTQAPTASSAANATQARAAIAQVVAATPDGAAGVSAWDMTTGTRITVGSTTPMWTASMYKLLVLETLLREDGPLDGEELDEATAMIEQSDNAAGYELYEDAGGNEALGDTLGALGVTDAVLSDDDPTFTRLAPADAVAMAHALVGPGMLSAASRAQALDLMRNVEADQRWGVGVVADTGTTFANKNGWLSVDNTNGDGDDDGGRWIVSSVGIVQVGGHEVLLAAMTEHRSSEQDGIAALETMSKAAVTLLGLSPRA